MNLKDYPRKKYMINQYLQPICYELEGKSFRFIMDDGVDFDLAFLKEGVLQWNYEGQAPKEAEYHCLKGDDTTYIVDYEVEEFKNTAHRENHCFIIDLAQRLVTRTICAVGRNPKLPYLITRQYTFGAIETPGCPLPFKRHGFTADLVGTTAEWNWSTSLITNHEYFTFGHYRFLRPKMQPARERDFSNSLAALPNDDDIACFVKIKDNMYMFCLTEEHMERNLHHTNPPYRSNNMCFIVNFDRMTHVGRTFGTVALEDGTLVPCWISFGAFGNPADIDPEVQAAPNPYVV